MEIEKRKKEEVEFSNFVRGEKLAQDQEKYDYYHSNRKFYAINRKSRDFQEKWLKNRCRGKKALVLGCGAGAESFFLAKNGAQVIGIDIAEVGIKEARETAKKEGVSENTSFLVMDAEKLEFDDNTFDLVTASGMIHHIDFSKLLPEASRVIRPGGSMICIEPLAYNPVFQLYRKLTPHLRTEWESKHILTKREIYMPKKYFGKVEARFFHLFVLLAVPFRKTFIFKYLLSFLEAIDSIVLRLPLIKWFAWQVVFISSEPKK